MARKIEFNLSVKSIEKAIKDMESYKLSLRDKCDEFCIRMTALGATTAQAYIAESPLGKYVTVSTDIQPETMGCKAILFATAPIIQNGDSEPYSIILGIEFGSGIFYNPTANPKASELGYGVGTFPNSKHSFDDGWFYKGNDDEWHFTHGTPATMPMYASSEAMILNIRKIAKEVFNK